MRSLPAAWNADAEQTDQTNFRKDRMKKMIYTASLAFAISLLAAQTPQPAEKKIEQEKKGISIVKDLDANGIDDAKEKNQGKGKQGMRSNDQFIDANGDGICDSREQGLGFRRGKGQSTTQTGKRQQGRQK